MRVFRSLAQKFTLQSKNSGMSEKQLMLQARQKSLSEKERFLAERHQQIAQAHEEMSRLMNSIYASTARLLSHYKIGQGNRSGPLKDQVIMANKQIDLLIDTKAKAGIIWIDFTEYDLVDDEDETEVVNAKKPVIHTTCNLELHKFLGAEGKVGFQISSLTVDGKSVQLTTRPDLILNPELAVAERMYQTFENDLMDRTVPSLAVH